MHKKTISGQFVDIPNREIFPARITIYDKRIASVERMETASEAYILPGFIDAHVHIESSMLVPSEFARIAVVHGTVATVSDPHEIANVCGMEGVQYMVDNGQNVNFKFYFGAPSCVPATPFETAGGEITAKDIGTLLKKEHFTYLAEMMNWPGVINRDPEVLEKIAVAQKYGKPVDGHAPGLKGELAGKYISAGISTDHECFTKEEALDKLKHGMKIAIREGSAAKNFEALVDLIDEYPDHIMLCSDDKHPDNLVEGHINQLAARAVAKGKDLFKVLKAACLNPIDHYNMNVGKLREGDPADLILVKDLESFEVLETLIDGETVAKAGESLIAGTKNRIINNFHASRKSPGEFAVKARGEKIRVIEAKDGELITSEKTTGVKTDNGYAVSDTDNDILKIAVINRYRDAPPAIAFIKNFGLKEGAIASSVAHDSHNIIAVGTDDRAIAEAVNLIIDSKGGISAVNRTEKKLLALPVGGIMSAENGYKVAREYTAIDKMAKMMGATLHSPFMTLSFMALLVIPDLKLSDKGLFDGQKFAFTDLFPS
ncbi:adenine deaminase [Sinomicrobium weinanense]|uniref:Adenine deaminase n=1 Tax=Sinomicrobium weinanense TaxID=2842200 RepID=A0A926Q3T1_9FLAO|nr:adenine deaminase [Sinomicrobium weinanense]MBC9797902.1 adenine deaminase [Sinomicrobium weinanense]MBU3125439.1 adenine deaminase [Sinomicrobium weinanense]